MRVVENTPNRLVLKGIPGSLQWMMFATLLGVAIMAGTGWFGWVTVRETNSYWQVIPLAIGFVLGSFFFVMGLWTLLAGRMRLVLDREVGTGTYQVKSPVINVGKPCSFQLEHVDSVVVERKEESRPDSDEKGSFPAQVCLRIRKPRRKIVLDETENGREQRVEAVAESVADWLELEISRQS